MKICLLGEYSGDLDEGMRKVSYYLAQELQKKHEVLTLDLRQVFSKDFWKEVKAFEPDIVQHVHGPSIMSLALLKSLAYYSPGVKTASLAIHPRFSFLSKVIAPMLKADMIFVQSPQTEHVFQQMRCRTEFLPCGVDTERFVPVSGQVKRELRRKYGVDETKYIVLHIGAIKEPRNIRSLMRLQNEDTQVIIVGALSADVNESLKTQLERAGCLVWLKYFENVADIYSLADCYVFPTLPADTMSAIETPLSVLEAMSCNLPVVTTRFGALPRIFHDGKGLYFIDKDEELTDRLATVRNGISTQTREMVLPFSWEKVVGRLEKLYQGLISS